MAKLHVISFVVFSGNHKRLRFLSQRKVYTFNNKINKNLVYLAKSVVMQAVAAKYQIRLFLDTKIIFSKDTWKTVASAN